MKDMKKSYTSSSVFFHSSPVLFMSVFRNCLRVPEVMNRVIMARQILNKYKWPVPMWMMSLVDKRDEINMESDSYFISFLLLTGFYDRFCRLFGKPRFLIGFGPAVCVSARVKNFESTVMEMATGDFKPAQKLMKIFKRTSKKWDNFSALPSVKSLQYSMRKNRNNERNIRVFSVAPSIIFQSENHKRNNIYIRIEDWMEKDAQLSWLWPVLKHYRDDSQWAIKSKFISFSSNYHCQ